jgi:hypothetical protein
MNNYINLVQSKDEIVIKEKKRVRILNFIAASFLTIVVVCAIVIFVISSQFSLTSIKRDQNQAIYGISQLKIKAGKLLMVNDRLKGISDISDKRKDYSTVSNYLVDLVPQGVSIKAFSLDKETVRMTVSSNSLLQINTFLNSLISLSSQKRIIKNLIMDGIVVNPKTGQYLLSVSGIII